MLDFPGRNNNGDPVSALVPDGAASLLDVWIPATERIRAGNASALHAADQIAQSWAKFVGARVSKDAAFPQQLIACRNVNDVFLAYSRFWQEAAKDYSHEWFAIFDAAISAIGNGRSAVSSGL